MPKIINIVKAVLLLVLFMFPAFAQTKPPLSLGDIFKVLRAKEVSLDERNRLLTEGVTQRGITFQLTADIENELKKTGANAKLIEAIKQKSPAPEKPEKTPPKTNPQPTVEKTSSKIKVISDNDLTNDKQITQAIGYYSDYTNSADLSPTDKALAFRLRADLYAQKGKYDAAVADYEAALQLNPKDVSAYYERGFIYYNNLQNPDSAIADFTNAIKLDAKFTLAYLWRGRCYFLKNDLNSAVADFNKADQLSPNSNWLIYEFRAAVLEKQNQPAAAEADRQKARSLNF